MRRQHRNAFAFCLAVYGFIRLSIVEPLAVDPFDRLRGAGFVINVKSDALVVPEIEFAQITLQMSGAHMMICADEATF